MKIPLKTRHKLGGLGNERENTLLVEDKMLPHEKACEGSAYSSVPCRCAF